MCFRVIGVDLRVEDASSHGSANMVVLTRGRVFVLEIKMSEGDDDTENALVIAIVQMRDMGYAEKYRNRGEPVHLVGVACGREVWNLLQIRAESYPMSPGFPASLASAPAPAPPGNKMPAPVTLSGGDADNKTGVPSAAGSQAALVGNFQLAVPD